MSRGAPRSARDRRRAVRGGYGWAECRAPGAKGRTSRSNVGFVERGANENEAKRGRGRGAPTAPTFDNRPSTVWRFARRFPFATSENAPHTRGSGDAATTSAMASPARDSEIAPAEIRRVGTWPMVRVRARPSRRRRDPRLRFRGLRRRLDGFVDRSFPSPLPLISARRARRRPRDLATTSRRRYPRCGSAARARGRARSSAPRARRPRVNRARRSRISATTTTSAARRAGTCRASPRRRRPSPRSRPRSRRASPRRRERAVRRTAGASGASSTSARATTPPTVATDANIIHRANHRRAPSFAPPPTLATLQPDALSLILSRLDPRSLAACSSACRELRRAAGDDALWRAAFLARWRWRPPTWALSAALPWTSPLSTRATAPPGPGGWRAAYAERIAQQPNHGETRRRASSVVERHVVPTTRDADAREIQAALDVSRPGDVVLVHAGTYAGEGVRVPPGVELRGVGRREEVMIVTEETTAVVFDAASWGDGSSTAEAEDDGGTISTSIAISPPTTTTSPGVDDSFEAPPPPVATTTTPPPPPRNVRRRAPSRAS